MLDVHGRNIEYLRISVTRDCNLNCLYCKPGTACRNDDQFRPLSPADYGKIVRTAAELGIRKVRITGGEPLVRHDIYEIISVISSVEGIDDISMTTNGIHLEQAAQRLKDAGLTRVNVSLDSLNEDNFRKITGVNKLHDVLNGIRKAAIYGLVPVKTNTVLIKGLNDYEVDDFFRLARDMELDVRFIELMPVGEFGEENRDKIVYNTEIIAAHPELVPVESVNSSEPARYYTVEGYKGRIGFISPISSSFCSCCDRIRLTCDGKIKPCLGNNREVDIMELLDDPEGLKEMISRTVFQKPEKHSFEDNFVSNRKMNEIGG